MPDPSYQKIAIISDKTTEVTIPTENIEHDAENDLTTWTKANTDGGSKNKRSIFNLNQISSQNSPKVSLSNESVRQLNEVNAIGGKYPSSERSWLPKTKNNGDKTEEWKYAKESARAAIEDIRESGDPVEIEIFDIRALTEDNKDLATLRTTAPKSLGSTARWPNTGHPTYRRYLGYIKTTKFRERGNETSTRYDLNLTFEIGVEASN